MGKGKWKRNSWVFSQMYFLNNSKEECTLAIFMMPDDEKGRGGSGKIARYWISFRKTLPPFLDPRNQERKKEKQEADIAFFSSADFIKNIKTYMKPWWGQGCLRPMFLCSLYGERCTYTTRGRSENIFPLFSFFCPLSSRPQCTPSTTPTPD